MDGGTLTRWDGPLTRAHKPARRGDGSILVWLVPLLVFWATVVFLVVGEGVR